MTRKRLFFRSRDFDLLVEALGFPQVGEAVWGWLSRISHRGGRRYRYQIRIVAARTPRKRIVSLINMATNPIATRARITLRQIFVLVLNTAFSPSLHKTLMVNSSGQDWIASSVPPFPDPAHASD